MHRHSACTRDRTHLHRWFSHHHNGITGCQVSVKSRVRWTSAIVCLKTLNRIICFQTILAAWRRLATTLTLMTAHASCPAPTALWSPSSAVGTVPCTGPRTTPVSSHRRSCRTVATARSQTPSSSVSHCLVFFLYYKKKKKKAWMKFSPLFCQISGWLFAILWDLTIKSIACCYVCHLHVLIKLNELSRQELDWQSLTQKKYICMYINESATILKITFSIRNAVIRFSLLLFRLGLRGKMSVTFLSEIQLFWQKAL